MYRYLLRRIRRHLLFYLNNFSYQSLLFFAEKGLRMNVFRSRKVCRQAKKLYQSIPALDQGQMESMVKLLNRLKQMQNLQVIEVTSANIGDCISSLLEVENAAFPQGFRMDAENLCDRFYPGNHRPPICYLYLKSGKPVAYTLGTYLEFYPPWEYGFELSAHPGFLRFTTFYFENICVLPSEQHGGLGMRSAIETILSAQMRDYQSIVLHARIKSGARDFGLKLGFSQLKLIEGFLQSAEVVALMTCFFPNSDSKTNYFE